MQNEWDLGVKAACLAYNTTVHSSTGQTPFFATFGREAIVPIHWVYPIPRPDAEKDVSAWTETIQERFQTAYAGMRERQQQMVRRNAQYYKPIENQFNIGQWVWIFDPRIIPGSCDKLRSYWAGPYKIVRLLAPALAEVIAVYEQGKPRIVSLDILKEFRGENNVHGLPSDPPHPAFVGGDEITEIPSSGFERPITEEIKKLERQADKRERDPGDRRETAGQAEQQVIRQTDRETQITSSCEMNRGGTPPSRSGRGGGNARRR